MRSSSSPMTRWMAAGSGSSGASAYAIVAKRIAAWVSRTATQSLLGGAHSWRPCSPCYSSRPDRAYPDDTLIWRLCSARWSKAGSTRCSGDYGRLTVPPPEAEESRLHVRRESTRDCYQGPEGPCVPWEAHPLYTSNSRRIGGFWRATRLRPGGGENTPTNVGAPRPP